MNIEKRTPSGRAMRVAMYVRKVNPDYEGQVEELRKELENRGIEVTMTSPESEVFEAGQYDFVVSVGGDGTLLSSVHHIVDSGIPVVGVNFGHLGFLTTVGRDSMSTFVDDMIEGRYTVEERTLLHVNVKGTVNTETFALNEVSVHRMIDESLIHTHLYVDDEFVATYDADGLIVATPTGSTAYSLSCGGPILTPNSGCFVITPIGAHQLTLRPMIVPDTATIRLVSESRSPRFSMELDSRNLTLPTESEINVCRERFTVRLVRMNNQNFFNAIHEKLSWGC